MPALQSMLAEVNYAFGKRQINELAKMRHLFGPEKGLDTSPFLKKGSRLHKAWVEYERQIPDAFRETLRSIIYHALSTKPATQITFAWAPGYDFELTMWQAPDTSATKGGITVLVKSRYPADKHPLARARRN